MFFLYFFFFTPLKIRKMKEQKNGRRQGWKSGGRTNESDRRKKVFGRGTGEVGLRVAVQRYYLLRGRALVVFSGLPSLVFGVWSSCGVAGGTLQVKLINALLFTR